MRLGREAWVPELRNGRWQERAQIFRENAAFAGSVCFLKPVVHGLLYKRQAEKSPLVDFN
jgi:hypothetical protein